MIEKWTETNIWSSKGRYKVKLETRFFAILTEFDIFANSVKIHRNVSQKALKDPHKHLIRAKIDEKWAKDAKKGW